MALDKVKIGSNQVTRLTIDGNPFSRLALPALSEAERARIARGRARRSARDNPKRELTLH